MRSIINKFLIVLFVVVIIGLSFTYVSQQRSIADQNDKIDSLTSRLESLEYTVEEYILLRDSEGTQDFIIRCARDLLGWVFDGEVIYKTEK